MIIGKTSAVSGTLGHANFVSKHYSTTSNATRFLFHMGAFAFQAIFQKGATQESALQAGHVPSCLFFLTGHIPASHYFLFKAKLDSLFASPSWSSLSQDAVFMAQGGYWFETPESKMVFATPKQLASRV